MLLLFLNVVVHMDLWLYVKDKVQQGSQDLLPVLLEFILEDSHLLLGILCHLSGRAATGAKSLM